VITCTRVVAAPTRQVWDVLADGWLYPLFVVGASRMRQVDDAWPAPGSKLHHSVGAWPALLDDVTEVVESEPLSRLALRAHAWPAGRADVELRLDGHGSRTEVSITEDVASGPARLVPGPVRRPQIAWRNQETLRRLAYLAEGRG